VSPSSTAAAQKGNGDGDGFGFNSARVEPKWSVAKLLGWMDGAMRGCGGRSARARSRRPWRTVEEGRKRGSHATAGVLGLFIGERSPGRGERRLGKADLVRGDSTASWRREQAASCMAGRRGGSGVRQGRVLAWGGAKRQARWRWRAPSGPLGRGRAVDKVHRQCTDAQRRGREKQRGEMKMRAYL